MDTGQFGSCRWLKLTMKCKDLKMSFCIYCDLDMTAEFNLSMLMPCLHSQSKWQGLIE